MFEKAHYSPLTHSLTPASSDGLQWWPSTVFCPACLSQSQFPPTLFQIFHKGCKDFKWSSPMLSLKAKRWFTQMYNKLRPATALAILLYVLISTKTHLQITSRYPLHFCGFRRSFIQCFLSHQIHFLPWDALQAQLLTLLGTTNAGFLCYLSKQEQSEARPQGGH